MFTEILKIIPKLDDKAMAEMQKTLSTRFTKIAKGFGSALKTTLLGAVGTAVLSRLMSPLNEVREAIDRTLKTADDIITNKAQFGTSAEALIKLRALAGLKGLGPEQLDLLLSKFQTATAQVTRDPNDESVSSVRNFAGRTDTAAAFFEFIQQLQKLNPMQQTLVQEQIFGQKQILKMSEFLQSNFEESFRDLRGVDFSKAAMAVTKLEQLEGIQTKNRTINGINDLISKGSVINQGTIGSINETEIANLRRENKQIAGFQNAAKVEEAINKINENINELLNQALTQLPIIITALNGVVGLLKLAVDGWKQIFDLLKNAPMFRGIKSLFGGGKDD